MEPEKKMDSKNDKKYVRVEDLQHDDKWVQFYTIGFTSFALFLAFLALLLTIWTTGGQ